MYKNNKINLQNKFILSDEINRIKNRFNSDIIIILCDIVSSINNQNTYKIFIDIFRKLNQLIFTFDKIVLPILDNNCILIKEYNNKLENMIIENLYKILDIILSKLGFDMHEKFDYLYWLKEKKHLKEIWDDMSKNSTKNGFESLFNDFHDNCIDKYETPFVISLDDVGVMYRASSWNLDGVYENMITPAKYAKNNRWNPDGIAFMYLTCGNRNEKFDNSINLAQKTCFEEIRLENNSDVVICEFKPIKQNIKLFNLYFENDEMFDVMKNFNENSNNLGDDIVKLISEDTIFLKECKKTNNPIKIKKKLEYKIKPFENKIKKQITEDMGLLFISLIDKTIFEPIEKETDPELKAYEPFRKFSSYLQSKGYAGIVYRSTRMNKIKLKGKNVVLFNNDYASFVPDSMKKFKFENNNYFQKSLE